MASVGLPVSALLLLGTVFMIGSEQLKDSTKTSIPILCSAQYFECPGQHRRYCMREYYHCLSVVDSVLLGHVRNYSNIIMYRDNNCYWLLTLLTLFSLIIVSITVCILLIVMKMAVDKKLTGAITAPKNS